MIRCSPPIGDVGGSSGCMASLMPTSSATGIPTGVTETVNNVSLVNGHSLPEIDEDSGDVMYIENRAPVARSVDQTENVKLIIEF